MSVFNLITPENKANKETIKLLSHFLELAKKGEVAEIALIAVYSDFRHEHAFTPCRIASIMLGAVSRMQHSICEEIGENYYEAKTPEA